MKNNVIIVSLLVGAFIIAAVIVAIPSKPVVGPTQQVVTQNIEMRDGIQYITIDAGGGYSPRRSTAKAGVSTKLVVRTNGTYDCSSSLTIRSINYQDILPASGETVIDAGTLQPGTSLQGVCGMGMYSFLIKFT